MPVAKISGSCGGQNSPVFVDQVELVEVNERVESSWIWFQVTNELHGSITGFPGFVFQPAFESVPVASGGEGCVIRGSAIRYGAGRDEIVESGAQIVNGIANSEWDSFWQWFRERYVEPMLARTKVRFMPDLVRVLTEIPEDQKVHLSNVRLRALQLQKRA